MMNGEHFIVETEDDPTTYRGMFSFMLTAMSVNDNWIIIDSIIQETIEKRA